MLPIKNGRNNPVLTAGNDFRPPRELGPPRHITLEKSAFIKNQRPIKPHIQHKSLPLKRKQATYAIPTLAWANTGLEHSLSQAQQFCANAISEGKEKYSHLFKLLYPEILNKKCPPAPAWETLPPLENPAHTDLNKLAIAQSLSSWVEQKMNKSQAQVAVLARGGSHLSKTKDRTWMEHSGLLLYNPNEGGWQVYNLLNDFCDGRPTCRIVRHSLLDFFYSQPNYDRDALLLLPSKKLQKNLQSALQNGQYRQLQFTDTYNLVTRFDGDKSLNCNKWVLMNLIAAQTENYQPKAVLEEIGKTFEPGRVRVCPLIRPLAKQHPTVLQSEAPLTGPINTVTAESLYRSGFFEEKAFFSGKTV